MKYLSHYTGQAQTDTFKKHGAFFAFSNKQFDEQKQENIKYISLGHGLITPENHAIQLMEDLEKVNKAGIQADLAENGVKAIIHRELANHECQITSDYSAVVNLLSAYEITEKQVHAEWSEFYQNCIDNDYF